MIDIDLTTQALRNYGHTVGNVIPVPENAGDYEIEVDGELLSLAEVNTLLEEDESR
jgi:predicted Rdx family selenoprotein